MTYSRNKELEVPTPPAHGGGSRVFVYVSPEPSNQRCRCKDVQGTKLEATDQTSNSKPTEADLAYVHQQQGDKHQSMINTRQEYMSNCFTHIFWATCMLCSFSMYGLYANVLIWRLGARTDCRDPMAQASLSYFPARDVNNSVRRTTGPPFLSFQH
jgi:hypothetical protein